MRNMIVLRASAIILLTALSLVSVSPLLAKATPPTQIVLNYNVDTQTLAVNVTHEVPNPGNHYVELIEVFKNGLIQFNKTYQEQEFNYGLSDTFTISASEGDNLTVTATCTRAHFLSNWIIVSAFSPTGGTDTSPTQPNTLGSFDAGTALVIGLMCGLVLLVVLGGLRPDLFEPILQRLRLLTQRI